MASFKAAATRLVERARSGRPVAPTRWPSRPIASTGSSSAARPPSPRRAISRPHRAGDGRAARTRGDGRRGGRRPRGRGCTSAAVEGDWGRTPGTERSRLLHALADAIVANRAELAELEARNVGKAISSVKAELHQAVENFRYYGSAIATIGGRANPIGGSLLFYSLKEPVGVAAQIVPWNYPLMMATWKLAPALAAGCSVVLKPDPQTPLTAIRLAELAAEVGFPAGARERRSRRRADDGRLPREASGRRQGRVHGLDEDGRRDHAARLRSGEAGHARARRQEPEPRLRGRRPRRRAAELGLVDLLRRRAELRGALAHARREAALRRGRRASGRARGQGSRSAIRSIPRRRWGRSSRRRTAIASTASSSAARRDAEVVAGGSVPDGAGVLSADRRRGDQRPRRSRRRRSSARSSPSSRSRTRRTRSGSRTTSATGSWRRSGPAIPARGHPHRGADQVRARSGSTCRTRRSPGIPFGGYKQSGFGRELALETLDLYLETKSVIVSTGARPINPFGL